MGYCTADYFFLYVIAQLFNFQWAIVQQIIVRWAFIRYANVRWVNCWVGYCGGLRSSRLMSGGLLSDGISSSRIMCSGLFHPVG